MPKSEAAAQSEHRTSTAVGVDLQLADVTVKLPSSVVHFPPDALAAPKMWPWDRENLAAP